MLNLVLYDSNRFVLEIAFVFDDNTHSVIISMILMRKGWWKFRFCYMPHLLSDYFVRMRIWDNAF